MTLKEKAHFVFKHRHLIVKRRENFKEAEHDDLKQMIEYLAELAMLRRFADRIYKLFDTPKDFHQASCRRAAIIRDPQFRAVPELLKAMEQLDEEKFPKLMAYLNNPVSQQVWTNNHVERTNRMFRFFEKVRYKWRRRRILNVRFIIRPPASTALDKPRGLWNLVDVVTESNFIRAIVTWMSPMPFPFAETIALTDLQRPQLESLIRASSTPQALVFRCRLILRVADKNHPTNLQIAAEFECNPHTVAMWRNRYLLKGLAGLQDAPRSERPRRFSPLGEAQSDQFGEQHNRTATLSRHPLVAG